MNLHQAFSLSQRIAKGRWLVAFVCFLIMSVAGGTYMFGIYSESIKTVLGYNQQTLTTLGFFKDLGGNFGVLSGLINEITPPWVVLGIGALMNITGYLLVWLSVTQRMSKPKPWQMYLYICIGANSQTFANTGALVTCVKSFPKNRGAVLGILKGFVGLSGAIFTQIYHAFYGNDSRAVILLLGWLPTSVSLLLMLIVRPIKSTSHKNELKSFYHFLYIALAMAGFLMVLIIIENHEHHHFPKSGYQIATAIVALFLLSNFIVVVKAEMNQTKEEEEQQQQSAETNGVLNGASVEMENMEDGKQELPRSRFVRIFKGPKRGEDFTIPQALASLDMVIVFVAATCGIGATLTAIVLNISTFISLISIWNFLGRVAAGFLSDFLLQKYRFPRPVMVTTVLVLACVGHVFIAFALPGSLYVASIVIGLCFGALWPLLYAIISELFGIKYFATIHTIASSASPVGAYLLSVRTAGVLYDREARKHNGLDHTILFKGFMKMQSPPAPAESKLTCSGHHCFRLSFIIMTLVTLFGALVSFFLVVRTSKFYKTDVYAKFRTQEDGEDREQTA